MRLLLNDSTRTKCRFFIIIIRKFSLLLELALRRHRKPVSANPGCISKSRLHQQIPTTSANAGCISKSQLHQQIPAASAKPGCISKARLHQEIPAAWSTRHLTRLHFPTNVDENNDNLRRFLEHRYDLLKLHQQCQWRSDTGAEFGCRYIMGFFNVERFTT